MYKPKNKHKIVTFQQCFKRPTFQMGKSMRFQSPHVRPQIFSVSRSKRLFLSYRIAESA